MSAVRSTRKRKRAAFQDVTASAASSSNSHSHREESSEETSGDSQSSSMEDHDHRRNNGRQHRKKVKRALTQHDWGKEQNYADRRDTRMAYRTLGQHTHQNRAKIADINSNEYRKTLRMQNELFSQVHHPTEAAMDIEQTQRMADILVQQAESISKSQFCMTAEEYIDQIIDKYGAAANNTGLATLDWERMGDDMAPFYYTPPQIAFMNGVLSRGEQLDEKPKRVAQRPKRRVKREADVEEKKPETVTRIKETDITDTKWRVQKLKSTLRHCDRAAHGSGLKMFDFLINPQSFSETIENFFDMSFLAREGYALIDVDEATQEPVLSYVKNEQRLESIRSNMANGQCVVQLNTSMWRSISNTHQLRESQIVRPTADEVMEMAATADAANKGKHRRHRQNEAVTTNASAGVTAASNHSSSHRKRTAHRESDEDELKQSEEAVRRSTNRYSNRRRRSRQISSQSQPQRRSERTDEETETEVADSQATETENPDDDDVLLTGQPTNSGKQEID